MSHVATAWAIQQRGISPTQKVVLWCLADRHNPDFGCFPSQEKIAEDAEISLRTVKDCLQSLEEKGLLRREIYHGNKGYRAGTRYILAFEDSFMQDLHLGGDLGAESRTAYVQDLPTNLVKEPVNIKPLISPKPKSDFEPSWKAFPHVKGRSSKAKSEAIFKKMSPDHQAGLEKAINAYTMSLSNRDLEFVPAMDRWLRDGKYIDFLPRPSSTMEKDRNAARRSAISVFIASGRWDNSAGTFPTDEEVEAFKASRPVKTELF